MPSARQCFPDIAGQLTHELPAAMCCHARNVYKIKLDKIPAWSGGRGNS